MRKVWIAWPNPLAEKAEWVEVQWIEEFGANLDRVQEGDIDLHWSSLGGEDDLGRRRHSICDVRITDVQLLWYKAVGRFPKYAISSAIDAHEDILTIVLE